MAQAIYSAFRGCTDKGTHKGTDKGTDKNTGKTDMRVGWVAL